MKNEPMNKQAGHMMPGYKKFPVMMAVSFVIMYGAMFLNVDEGDHIYLSLTRTYMTLLMVSPMAVLMVSMMKGMYPNRKTNTAIIAGSIVVFALALTALRTQTPVGDVQWMKGMIPHHSSAIMTSRHANLKDPEARQLADSIIASQEREIAQMKRMLARMQ